LLFTGTSWEILGIILPGFLFSGAVLLAFPEYARQSRKKTLALITISGLLYPIIYTATFIVGMMSGTLAGFIPTALGAWIFGLLLKKWWMPFVVEPTAGLVAIATIAWFIGSIPAYLGWLEGPPQYIFSPTILVWQWGIGGSFIEWEEKYRPAIAP
jgi:hypothetical protein